MSRHCAAVNFTFWNSGRLLCTQFALLHMHRDSWIKMFTLQRYASTSIIWSWKISSARFPSLSVNNPLWAGFLHSSGLCWTIWVASPKHLYPLMRMEDPDTFSKRNKKTKIIVANLSFDWCIAQRVYSHSTLLKLVHSTAHGILQFYSIVSVAAVLPHSAAAAGPTQGWRHANSRVPDHNDWPLRGLRSCTYFDSRVQIQLLMSHNKLSWFDWPTPNSHLASLILRRLYLYKYLKFLWKE